MEKDNDPLTDYAQYLNSKSLIESLSVYSNADTLKAYDESYAKNGANKIKFAPVVMAIGETMSLQDSLEDTQSKLLAELKKQVTELIKDKTLVPTGFLVPRASTSKPESISLEIFLSSKVNWDKSECIYNDLVFSEIRLIENQSQKIKTNNFQRSGGLVIKVKKSDKSNFSGLGSSHHLNEKDAASYLGISNRVLQGLRIKNNGPEFTKVGQAIRYKIADLVTWLDKV